MVEHYILEIQKDKVILGLSMSETFVMTYTIETFELWRFRSRIDAIDGVE